MEKRIIQYQVRCRNCKFETVLLDDRRDAETALSIHQRAHRDHFVELGQLEVVNFSALTPDEKTEFLRAGG